MRGLVLLPAVRLAQRVRVRLEQARLAFEKMFTYANHLGLYAEEVGLTGEQLGSFPRRSPTCR
jgi:hypothetical protein